MRPLNNIFKSQDYPDLLVGIESPDDSAVWKLDEKRYLVATTDFFTPVLDDPYAYGAVAAANSLSDVYAMGGQPFLALNIAAMPPNLPHEVISDILRGGAEKAREAGVVIGGGHTIQDEEPKYGMVVLGFVSPDQVITKRGACPGDQLFLTKPLGFGVTTTAIKRDMASQEDIDEVTSWMMKLNRGGRDLAVEHGVRGGTDITGYSLLGHAFEMAQASNVGLRIEMENLPFIHCAHKYAEAWTFPGGAADNKIYFSRHVRFGGNFSEAQEMLLYDPQTSGGLLLAVPKRETDAFQARALTTGQPAWRVGEVVEGEHILVY